MKIIRALASIAIGLFVSPTAQAEQGTVEDQVIEWINNASFTELQEVKGIGPATARKIVAGQIKEFHTYKDITDIKGIGPVLLKEIIKHVEAIDPD